MNEITFTTGTVTYSAETSCDNNEPRTEKTGSAGRPCSQCACGLSEKYVAGIIDQVQNVYDAAAKVIGHSVTMDLKGHTHADTLKLGYYLGLLNAAVNAVSIEADVCKG